MKYFKFKIWEVLFILIIVLVSGLIAGTAFVMVNYGDNAEQTTYYIEITSETGQLYPGAAGNIAAVVVDSDGNIYDDCELIYTSDNSNFIITGGGDFTVVQDDSITESYTVNVTVSCTSFSELLSETCTFEIIVATEAISDYTITYYYCVDDYNAGADKQVLLVDAGQYVYDSENSLPSPELENWTFDGWWYYLYGECYKFDYGNYDYGCDLTLFARYTSTLALDDDMGNKQNFTDDGGQEIIIYYQEEIGYELPVLESVNGWTFDGWYTSQAGEGNKYSGGSDAYGESAAVLYAKWVGTITLYSEIDGDGNYVETPVSSEINLVYNTRLTISLPAAGGWIFGGYYASVDWSGAALEQTSNYTGAAAGYYAKWTTNQYIDSIFSGQSETNLVYNAKLVLRNPQYTNDGVFIGWYYIADGVEIAIDSANTPYAYEVGVNADIYAKVKFPIEFEYYLVNATSSSKYYILYNGNMADIGYSDLPSVANTSDGWVFEGWYTEISEGCAQFTTNTMYSPEAESAGKLTLYAKWTTTLSVDSIFNGTSTCTAVYNGALTIAEAKYTNDGEFVGWYSVSDGKEVELVNGEAYMLGAEAEVYAKVKFPVEYVYYLVNGTTTTGEYYVLYNGTMSEVDCNELPAVETEKDGWKFEGWYTGIGEDGSKFTTSTMYTQEGKLTLYTKWTSKITLYSELDESGDAAATTTAVDVVYNYKVTIPTEQTAGAWVFGGYYTATGGSGDKIVSTANYTGESNLTLYAKWTTTLSVDSIFNGTSTCTAVYNGALTIAEAKYTNDGEFVGWYSVSDGKEVELVNGEAYMLGAEAEVYAKVKFPVEYVYYLVNGTTAAGEYYVLYNGTMAEVDCNELPAVETEKDGWKFEGWYTGIGEDGSKFTTSTMYTQEGKLTLYTKWTSKITLYSELDESGDAAATTTAVDVVYNYKVTIPTEQTAGAWVFGGYYTATGGSGDKIVSTANYTGESNLTLYAKWTTTLSVDSIFNGTSTCTAVYNGALTIAEAKYTNDGEFVGWYSVSYGKEVELVSGEAYMLGAEAEVYAKVKFPVEYVYYLVNGTTTTGEYYVLYNGTMSEVDCNELPAVETEKDGWKFEGWYTGIGEDGSKFTTSTMYTQEGKLTLYTKWTSKITLYSELDESGDAAATTTAVDVVYNYKVTIPTEQTAGAWVFGGYYTATGGSGDKIVSTANYTGESNLTLYAKWTTTLTLKTEDDVPLAAAIATTITVTYNVVPELPTPTYKAGTFGGWFTEQYGYGQEIATDQPYLYSAGAVLYDKIMFTVTLDYQEATSKNGGDDQYTAVYGRSLSSLYTYEPTPLKDSWNFGGWYTEMYGGGVEVTDNDDYIFAYDITIYAKWTGTITFVAVVTEYSDVVSDIVYGQALTVPDLGNSWGSWTFGGWFTEQYGDGTRVVSSTSYTGDAGLSFYAKWYLETLTLCYDNDITSSYTVTLSNVIYGKTIYESTGTSLSNEAKGTVAGFKNQAYSDGTWYNYSQSSQDKGSASLVTNDDKLFPKIMSVLYYWRAAETYTIYFYDDGSNIGSGTTEYYGELPEAEVLTKSHATFIGYYDSETGGNKIYNADGTPCVSYYSYTTDITVYAQWTNDIVFTLTDYNGSTYSSGDKYTVYVTPGNTLSKLTVPTRTGYTFGGYYSGQNGSGTQYYTSSMTSSITIGSGVADITLYPVWTAIPITSVTTGSGTSTSSRVSVGDSSVTITITVKRSWSGSYTYTVIDNSGYVNISSGSGTTSNETFTFTLTKKSDNQKGEITIKIVDSTNNESDDSCTVYYSTTDGGGCFAAGTLITMADGTTKAVEDISVGEEILVFNHETGSLDGSVVAYVFYDGYQEYETLTLYFSENISIDVLYGHGFFDVNLCEYIILTKENVDDYIGHEFYYLDDSLNGGVVKLLSYEIHSEYTECYSIVSAYYYNHFANGLLAVTDDIEGFYNMFKIGSDMKYDQELMAADIATYGLYTYEDWSEYITYEQFVLFGGPYLKVSVGKGLLTEEIILETIKTFLA